MIKMAQINFCVLTAYRNNLLKTRLLESPSTCSSQRWIHTTDNTESSHLQNIKRMYSGSDGNADSKGDSSTPVNRLKNNVTWVVSNIKLPNLSLPDWKKILPKDTSVTENLKKSSNKIVSNVTLKKQEWKKKQMAKKMEPEKEENNSASKKEEAFSSHIEDYNESIISFYDTSTAIHSNKTHVEKPLSETVTPKTEPKVLDGKLDDAWLTRMFGYAFANTTDQGPEAKPVVRKDFVSKSSIDSRTRALVHNLKQASSRMSKLKRTEDLCTHLIQFPDTRTTAVKEKCLPVLLRLHKTKDKALKAEVSQALSLVGYVHPPKGRGVRVLSIDGGGTRGVIAIRTLKMLQETCKTDITKLFDYVCGTSQGAILACLIFLLKVPLEDAEERYIEFSQMFNRNPFVGTGKLVWDQSFYDTDLWEQVLKQNFSEDRTMTDCSKNDTCPKVSAISCLMNVPKMKNFMFRTYNLPPGVYSHYPGNCKHKVWEAIRASSAAPVFLKEFILGDFVHQDGGLLSNNPSAIAVSECKLLWPNESIQCVVSLGNGRWEPNLEILTPTRSAVKDRVSKVIDSATNTENVHVILQDLLPPSTYFRFNPYLSENIRLDEKRSEKFEQMMQDTDMYLRRNQDKLQSSAKQLLLPRQQHQVAMDYIKLKTDSSFLADSGYL